MSLRRAIQPADIYFFGLCVLVTGLPLSMFLMSISQFVLGIAWVWDGNYSKKLKGFASNPTALLLTGLYLLHIIGVAYSSNYSYALTDLRIKLPLFTLPFMISTMPPLPEKRVLLLAKVFTGAVFAGTMVSMAVLLGFIHKNISDIRNISIFISHIRFSLLICMAIYCLAYRLYTRRDRYSTVTKAGIVLLIIWFVVFLLILQSVTGIAILLITLILLLAYMAVKQNSLRLKLAVGLAAIAIPLGTFLYLRDTVRDFYTLHPEYQAGLVDTTRQGTPYEHNLVIQDYENGYAIWVYVCWPEMESAWNKRSRVSFNGKDQKEQQIKYTLLRFLTSKGLRKDADGVNQLSQQEVEAVEKGITNVNYQGIFNFRSRIHVIIWEFDHYMKGANPSGHSVTQRLEFWRAALGIIREHPVTGVGTGDVHDAFREQYIKINSSLEERWRLFSHNQYLTFGVAFGITGLLYFLLTLAFPLFRKELNVDFIYCVFWMILVISMFTEDTLETQAGATFYAFFNSFLLFGRKRSG